MSEDGEMPYGSILVRKNVIKDVLETDVANKNIKRLLKFSLKTKYVC